jgi:type II secretory pathway pseudopilin PulG
MIALAVVGTISALAMPSFMENMKQQRKKAVFRETFMAIAHAVNEGVQSGEMDEATSPDYLIQQVNATKTCTGGEECGGYTSLQNISSSYPHVRGAVLPNGAAVDFVNYGSYWAVFVDWDGKITGFSEGPNVSTYDTIVLIYNPTSQSITNYAGVVGLTLGPGEIRPHFQPDHIAAYYDMMK